jgi:hypothetical protein
MDRARDPPAVEVCQVVERCKRRELLDRDSQAARLLSERCAGEAIEIQRDAVTVPDLLRSLGRVQDGLPHIGIQPTKREKPAEVDAHQGGRKDQKREARRVLSAHDHTFFHPHLPLLA